MKKVYLLLFVILLCPAWLYPGGFQVAQNGHKSIGMGLAGTSNSSDASCIFYNPGGLGLINKKFSLSVGASMAFTYFTYHDVAPSNYSADTKNPFSVVPYLFASTNITKWLKAGIGVYVQYGAISNWGEGSDWKGKYLIQRYDLNAINLQPTLAVKITDHFGIGGGFIYSLGSFAFSRAVAVQSEVSEGQVKLKGSTGGFGYNVGMKINIAHRVDIGLTYISQINLKFRKQEAEFHIPAAVSFKFPAENKFSMDFPLPAYASIGVSAKLSDKLMVGVQVDYTFWSVNDSMKVSFETTTKDLQDNNPTIPMKWKNTFTFHAGFDYKSSEKLNLRFGAYYDQTPIKDGYLSPLSIGGDMIGVTAGASYRIFPKISLDASFHYFDSFKREGTDKLNNFSGVYKIRAYFIGFGITYSI